MSGLKKEPVSNYDGRGLYSRQFSREDVEFVSCPFCGGDDYRIIAVERKSLAVVKCGICGLIYTNPRLKSPETVYWGDPGDYYEEAKLVFSGMMPHHRDRNYLADLKLIAKFKPRGNFLDIGSNAGFFLRLAKRRNCWDIYGIEPSKSLAELGRKHFGLNIRNCFLNEAGFADDFFDVVTMIDVFEHIINPAAMLEAVRRVIKDEGVLFIKVPNGPFNITKLRLSRLLGNSAAYDIFDSYEHLVHYTHGSLTAMLEKSGFRVIRRAIDRPIQTPIWHKYLGRYYQYPSPWILDCKNHILRNLFYAVGLLEYLVSGASAGCLAPNIIVIARKNG